MVICMVREIDCIELQQRLESEDAPILLDIRGENELMSGALPGYEHLPMHILPVRIAEYPKDRDIVLYCHSGARSHMACNFLMRQGYSNVINLRGGIVTWAQNGLNIELPAKACNS
jgi:rhodanese-related sulfurtransferase